MQKTIVIKDIPTNYDVFLDHVKESEGGYIHRNKKESDITNSYGIYRGRPAGAAMTDLWDYIEDVGSSITTSPTNQWSGATIATVEALLDDKVEKYLSYKFYEKYLKGARLELFPRELVLIMSNLYTNSPKGAWMSVQEALRDISKDGILPIPLSDLSIVDGDFGNKTRDSLLEFMRIADWKDKIIFRKAILLAMKTYYSNLIASNADKFLINIRGWNNRVEELEHI